MQVVHPVCRVIQFSAEWLTADCIEAIKRFAPMRELRARASLTRAKTLVRSYRHDLTPTPGDRGLGRDKPRHDIRYISVH